MTKKAAKVVKKAKPAKRQVKGMAGRTRSIRDDIVGKGGKVGGIDKKPSPHWTNSAALKKGDKRKLTTGETVVVTGTAKKPKKGPGSGKPNIHMKAKALGIDPKIPNGDKPTVKMEIRADVLHPSETKIGRPTTLTPELGSRYCTLIAQRYSPEDIEKLDGMPTVKTLYRWLAHSYDGKEGPLFEAFNQAYTRARELRAATRLDEINKIYSRMADKNTEKEDKLDANTGRVAVEIQRVLMELEDRAKYGRHVKVGFDPKNPLVVKRTAKDLSEEELLAIASGSMDNPDL